MYSQNHLRPMTEGGLLYYKRYPENARFGNPFNQRGLIRLIHSYNKLVGSLSSFFCFLNLLVYVVLRHGWQPFFNTCHATNPIFSPLQYHDEMSCNIFRIDEPEGTSSSCFCKEASTTCQRSRAKSCDQSQVARQRQSKMKTALTLSGILPRLCISDLGRPVR